MITNLVSGQQVSMNVTALNTLGLLYTQENDPASAFSFVDSLGNSWEFTLGTWNNGTNVFLLEAPVVSSSATVTLNPLYHGLTFPSSPQAIQFSLQPAYRGNFNLTGAVLAWDCTVYSQFQISMFDYSGNDHNGQAGDGSSAIIDDWFTPSSTYKTSYTSTPIVLGRAVASMSVNASSPYSGLIALLDSGGLSEIAQVDSTSNWAMTLIGVVIRKTDTGSGRDTDFPYYGGFFNINLVDPTHQPSKNLLAVLGAGGANNGGVGDGSIFLKLGSTFVASQEPNDSNQYWSAANQAVCLAMTLDYDSSTQVLTGTLFVNGTRIGSGTFTWNTFGGAAPYLQIMPAADGAYGAAIVDFAIFPSVLTQPQIAAQASAWGI